MANKYLGVDPMLTNVAIAYENDAYIADQIFPAFKVAKQSGKHFVYNQARFRVNDSLRGTGSPSNEVTLSLTVGSAYFADDHALSMNVSDEDVDNAITPTDPFVDATEFLMDQHMVSREVELAAMLADTGTMTQNTTLSGTSQWSDFNNSDPIANIETAKQTIHASIHKMPNTLILGKQVYDKLKHHPAVLERIKYSQKGIITADLLASLFEVERVLIGGAGKTTSAEGQTETTGYIWGKHAILAYVAPSVKPKILTLGLTYTWKTMKTERLRSSVEEDKKVTKVRIGDWYYDQKLVSALAGYLVKNAVA
jgi:hypothetical protein